uniref:Uncharacterized protein n=1 Tax=Lepeophtheirus salmonis TaxID=72036 RepID=A0A0K2UCY3_LEPSM
MLRSKMRPRTSFFNTCLILSLPTLNSFNFLFSQLYHSVFSSRLLTSVYHT